MVSVDIATIPTALWQDICTSVRYDSTTSFDKWIGLFWKAFLEWEFEIQIFLLLKSHFKHVIFNIEIQIHRCTFECKSTDWIRYEINRENCLRKSFPIWKKINVICENWILQQFSRHCEKIYALLLDMIEPHSLIKALERHSFESGF